MESIINSKSKKAARLYPKMMINVDEDRIVLFSSEDIGVVVWSTYKCNDVGSFSDRWIIQNFADFTGSITLSND